THAAGLVATDAVLAVPGCAALSLGARRGAGSRVDALEDVRAPRVRVRRRRRDDAGGSVQVHLGAEPARRPERLRMNLLLLDPTRRGLREEVGSPLPVDRHFRTVDVGTIDARRADDD